LASSSTDAPPPFAGTGIPDRGSEVLGEGSDFPSDIIALQLGMPNAIFGVGSGPAATADPQ
jgi:hypothetical protein